VFVVAMLTTGILGTVIAIVRNVAPAINIPAGLLTAYLVITALITVRLVPPPRWLNVGLMLVALSVALPSLLLGFETIAGGGKAMRSFPFFMFGVVALLAGVSDIGVMRSGRPSGASRLARHLWRMCFALFIASLSFFIGQADVFPKPIRIMPLLALPMLAVLVTMLYWLWRVRVKRNLRRIVGYSRPEIA